MQKDQRQQVEQQAEGTRSTEPCTTQRTKEHPGVSQAQKVLLL